MLFDFLPAEKAVNIIYKKNNKAHHYRDVPCVGFTCHCPQYNKYNIIYSVGKGIQWISAEGEIYCCKAGGDRQGAGDDICGIERSEYIIKQYGHCRGRKDHDQGFRFSYPAYCDL